MKFSNLPTLSGTEIRFSDFDFHKKTNKNLHTVYSVIAKEIILCNVIDKKSVDFQFKIGKFAKLETAN